MPPRKKTFQENLQIAPGIEEIERRIAAVEESMRRHEHRGYDSAKIVDSQMIRPRVGGGTLSYTIRDQGIFSFGDGSDGDVEITSNTTLTADKYYNTLQVKTGVVLSPDGFRIFVKDTCIIDGTIRRNGNNGNVGGDASNGTGGTGGTGGSAIAAGYFSATVAGVAGGDGGTNAASGSTGTTGTNVSNSIGSNGVTGGAGGRSILHANSGGGGGAAGTATASNIKLIANVHLATLVDVGSTGSGVKLTPSAGSGGGGGGEGDSGSGGGGGGGSASGGGIIGIYARILRITSNGVVECNGGTGGTGGKGAGGVNGGGGGGGGGGGNGGEMILVYNNFINDGSATVNGGSGGTGGLSGGGASEVGATGTAGTKGTVREFEISL